MVVIRLARGGRVHKPVYTLVVADSRKARNGRFLERVGQYDPNAEAGKELNSIKVEEIKTWISKGAVLSDTVRTLLKKNSIALS